VFVDGAAKRCGSSNVDDVFRCVLEGARASAQWIDLSKMLNLAPGDIHASVDVVSQLRNTLAASDASVVCVLGSGSVTDIVKHALFENKDDRPFLVVPTALTVTAFTSAFAVLEESGAKRTRISRPVTGCLWYAEVLAQAPAAMSRAGYGDLLARFVAYGDWYLSYELGMAENYNEGAYRLMEPFAHALKSSASDFASSQQTPASVERVSAALAMAGIAMSVSGETTPLSGYEHVISHALDFLRLTSGRPLVLHGEQVALATLSSAVSFDVLMEIDQLDSSKFRFLPEQRIRKMISAFLEQSPLFGLGELTLTETDRATLRVELQRSVDAACVLFTEEYLKKHAKWLAFQSQLPAFLQRWPEIRAQIRKLTLPAREMELLVAAAKLPLIPEDLNPPATAMEYRWALRFSPFVRGRMSLGDFIFWIGEDPALFAAV
jgi:glycerol-1-phosphate dehydrogenase [NAD(P)+]